MSKKSVITIACSIIGILVLILIVLWLITIVKHKHYTYEELEGKMIEAAQTYYKTNPELLPTNGNKATVAYETLVENKLLKPLDESLSDGNTCNGEVSVYNYDNSYDYIPKLTCGDKYTTRLLYEQILANNEVVIKGSGLHQDANGEYFFRGKVDNNYVSLGKIDGYYEDDREMLWKIISIDNDNRIKMMATYSTESTPYDTRYNVGQDDNTGYNTFEDSTLSDYLKSLEKTENFLTNEQKSKLSPSYLCVAKRNIYDLTKDGSTECSVLSKDKYLFGTITPYEFMRASGDPDCKDITSGACENLNFLTIADNWSTTSWTTTGVSTNNYEVYYYVGNSFETSHANNDKSIIPVVYVNANTMYKTGDGTVSNPYRLFKVVK